MSDGHENEILAGERFEFGANWARFLKLLNEERVSIAMQSLQTALGVSDLSGKRFLDAGCGSGLFSLAARRLGATVVSFDYDPQSVACTRQLRQRYFLEDSLWRVEEGSVLDRAYLKSLEQFEVVYSWGVLHHTGDMWRALDNVLIPLGGRGTLYISIYNDQGGWSRCWLKLKRIFNKLPTILRLPYVILVMGARELPQVFWALIKLKPMSYLRSWTEYTRHSGRGMSRWHDMVDWLGGYPFEVAKPDAIFDFFSTRGLLLKKLKTNAGELGCNEYVFVKHSARTAPSESAGD